MVSEKEPKEKLGCPGSQNLNLDQPSRLNGVWPNIKIIAQHVC